MKTPDEIKKGLECCLGDCHNYHCEECPYMNPDTENYDGCSDNGKKLAADALALIQQLEDHLREATKKIEQLEAERDAAVKDMHRSCFICKNFGRSECLNTVCNKCIGWCNWEWRGVQKEDSDD